MKYSFEIKERAIGKQRPRYSRKLGKMYTPTKTSTFEEKVKWAFKSKYNIDIGINMNPFKAKIIIQSKPAESLGRKAKEELIKNIWDLRKPDIDNITKAILDALNGLPYKDDNQVVMLYAEKKYGEENKICVELEEI
jgi:Holliday junction resolvase RusA-like endonuclease